MTKRFFANFPYFSPAALSRELGIRVDAWRETNKKNDIIVYLSSSI
jgi:hypothetical protein